MFVKGKVNWKFGFVSEHIKNCSKYIINLEKGIDIAKKLLFQVKQLISADIPWNCCNTQRSKNDNCRVHGWQ